MKGSEEDPTFSDMLFELSNNIRYKILKSIQIKPKRPSVIATQLGLSPPEVSRNFTRLYESSLITKDVDNNYSITNLGNHVLILLEDLEFLFQNRDYFVSHSSVKIPSSYQKRISELSNYSPAATFMEFVTAIDNIVKASKDFIWMYIDQYPLIVLDAIRSSLENGVKVRIIEHKNLLGPQIMFDKTYLVKTPNESPAVEIKMQNECDIYIIVSDAGSVVAFPTDTGFDYSGFITNNNDDTKWCIDIFNYYWENSEKADIADLINAKDKIELSNHVNTKKRADEWLKIFSRLSWSQS